MQFVALLRGINVGGANKVEMKLLKGAFEKAGFTDVKTYINSGNVLFSDNNKNSGHLITKIESLIEETFGLKIHVLIRTAAQIHELCDYLPDSWQNNAEMKCDVLFLWDEIDSPDVLALLPTPKEFEEVRYVSGAVLWKVDRSLITKSKMLGIIGTPLYKKMTIRNCNTVRKLGVLLGV